MIESNFSFAGKHCMTDFDLLYVEDNDTRVVSGDTALNTYEIAGMSGTLRYGGERHEVHRRMGHLYPMTSPPSEAAAQELMRRVAAWLKGAGRERLIFDHEPDRYLLAECASELVWSKKSWMEGGLDVTFDCQPYAYALRESVASASIGASGSVTITVDTGAPAPLCATITNTGSAALTGIKLIMGGRWWEFVGMSIAKNGVLRVSMERPVGASITQGGTATNALPCCERLDDLTVKGAASVSVLATYAGSGGGAHVTLTARGRWV